MFFWSAASVSADAKPLVIAPSSVDTNTFRSSKWQARSIEQASDAQQLTEDAHCSIAVVTTRAEDEAALLAHRVVVGVGWAATIILRDELALLRVTTLQRHLALAALEHQTAIVALSRLPRRQARANRDGVTILRVELIVDGRVLDAECVVSAVHTRLEVGHEDGTVPALPRKHNRSDVSLGLA